MLIPTWIMVSKTVNTPVLSLAEMAVLVLVLLGFVILSVVWNWGDDSRCPESCRPWYNVVPT